MEGLKIPDSISTAKQQFIPFATESQACWGKGGFSETVHCGLKLEK